MTMLARARPLGDASCATFHVTSHATWSETFHCHDHRMRNHTPPISTIDTTLDAIISNKACRFALRRARTSSSSETGDCEHDCEYWAEGPRTGACIGDRSPRGPGSIENDFRSAVCLTCQSLADEFVAGHSARIDPRLPNHGCSMPLARR
jgi:hypothetical protein